MADNPLAQLVAQQPHMRALDQAFYLDERIYQEELERIFMRVWLYAGHVSEIPRVGDWLLYELDRESVIIIRSGENTVRALINVCRHRGSRLCVSGRGHGRRLTCPYHGWTYDAEGKLVAAAHMGEDFDRSGLGLKSIACELLEGMIYINFADDPAPLRAAQEELGACLAPWRLATAKVAHRQSYPMAANWKLAVENYCECYHCAAAHPEYSRGHALANPANRTAAARAALRERLLAAGLPGTELDRKYGDEPGHGAGHGFSSYPLIRGHQTGSRSGQPVAPLMGSIRDYYAGCTDFEVGPVTFALAYADYVVIYAFKPLGPQRAACDISWLVRGDAEEGRDYEQAELTWLWDITTRADKRIIEGNALGVASRFYAPGPLSPMEYYSWDFLAWYLSVMGR